jgi:hypothetical protein
MGKSCTCCKLTCPKCANCDRKISSFDFKFSNKDFSYTTNVPVNQLVNDPCLKYFYIGDATGYYRQSGDIITRIAYKGYKMEISPTNRSQFSKDLIACNKNRDRFGQVLYLGDNDTIVLYQKINGSIIIIFPDERFFANRNSIYQVRFIYGNDKKMEFYFNPWDAEGFQNQLRNYESLDPSLIGKYPELKECTVNLTSYDLPQGNSLDLSVIDSDIICRADFSEYKSFLYTHDRQTCSVGCLGQLIYNLKTLNTKTWPAFLYLHKHANYKKTYHGFLITLSPDFSCGIFPNISEILNINPDGNTKTVTKIIKKTTTNSYCDYDTNCKPTEVPDNNFGVLCNSQRIETLSGKDDFNGDMSVECPVCRNCDEGFLNSRYSKSKSTTIFFENNFPEFFTVSSDFTVRTLPPEDTFFTSNCCCVGSNEIYKIITYFDFAFSYGNFTGCTNPLLPCVGHPGFNGSSCSELSVASEAQVKLNLEDLFIKNPTHGIGSLNKCLIQTPGQFFQYTLGVIPIIKGFKLDFLDYQLSCDTDFPIISTPDQWAGNSTDFINATNRYQTGILDCLDGLKDSRINKSISFNGISSDFNSISKVDTRLVSANFFSREIKSISDISHPTRSLSYKKQTLSALKFIDRINADPNSDLYQLIKAPSFEVKVYFLTNLVIDPRGNFLPPLSLLKMGIELIISDTFTNFGPKYILKSNLININNVNDINSTFILQEDVGVYKGIEFVPDPVFHQRPILIEVV